MLQSASVFLQFFLVETTRNLTFLIEIDVRETLFPRRWYKESITVLSSLKLHFGDSNESAKVSLCRACTKKYYSRVDRKPAVNKPTLNKLIFKPFVLNAHFNWLEYLWKMNVPTLIYIRLITLRYTAPVKCLFWKRLQMIAIGERLVKLLVDLNFENHPIIIHCFSNGGAFLYQNFILALEKSPQPIEIKGVIFDSAPGKRRILSLFRAISAIIGGRPFYNIPMSVLMTMFLSMIWLYEVISNFIYPKKTFQSNPLENLKNDKSNWPQHFIYSKEDVLIPYTDIEYFANYRKSLGIEVTSLCYEDSPHVKHYTENKESYVNSVCNFLNKCLNGTN